MGVQWVYKMFVKVCGEGVWVVSGRGCAGC